MNFAFRAWHDSKHIAGHYPFDRAGEKAAMQAQMRDVKVLFGEAGTYFCRLLHAEIMGQFDYAELHGEFPDDQLAFVRAYLANRSTALRVAGQ